MRWLGCKLFTITMIACVSACALDGQEDQGAVTSDEGSSAGMSDSESTSGALSSDDQVAPSTRELDNEEMTASDPEDGPTAGPAEPDHDELEISDGSVVHKRHRMQANGVIGIGRYTHWEKGNGHDGNGYSLRAYVEDTATDGLCAEVWLDFTTNPHEHHGPLLTYACGKKGWGIDPRHAESPKHNINGFRMAICRAKHPGQRFALRGLHNGDSRPMNCHEWNNHNAAGWAVRAWESNDDKITQVR